jgi:hypothetical protein
LRSAVGEIGAIDIEYSIVKMPLEKSSYRPEEVTYVSDNTVDQKPLTIFNVAHSAHQYDNT